MTAANVGTDPQHRFPIELGVRVGDGEVEASLEFGSDPLFAAGEVTWRDLPMPLFLMLNNSELMPWLRSCRASGDLDFELRSVDAEGPAGLTVHGTAQVADFALVDPDSGDFDLEWKSLDLVIREAFIPLDPASELPRRIDFERFEVVAPPNRRNASARGCRSARRLSGGRS